MVPTKPFLHSNESRFLQIPHPPPYRTLRHLQLSCHGGDGRPAESLLVSPAPQVEVHGDGPVGQVALVESLEVCHLPAPFELPVSCRHLAVWR